MTPSPRPPVAPAARRAKILASLVPLLLLLAGFTTWSTFRWKKEYARLAREKRAQAAALPLLERARESLAQAERYARLPNPDPEAIRERAEQAVEAASDALARFPEDPRSGSEEGHRLRGRALELLYNFDEARADYEQAVRLHPESPARLSLGVLSARELARARLADLKTTRNPEERLVERVVEPLRRFQTPRPEWNFEVDLESRALCTLLIAYALGDHERIPAAAAVVEGFDRTQWMAPYFEGATAAALGNDRAALSRLEEAARRAPGVADPYAWMGLVLNRSGRRSEALAALGTALSLTPHFPEAYYVRGLIRFEDGRYADARSDFDACVKLHPSLAEAHLKLGIASLEHWNRSGRNDPSDLERARRALDAYVSRRPEDASGRLLRARALLALGRPADAADDLSAVLARTPDSIEALALRAEVSEAQGDWARAESDYGAILERAPPAIRADALRGRARVRARLKRVDDARADYEQALASAPDDVGLYLEKARLELDAGRPGDARTTADRALTLQPRHAGIRTLRAEALLALGEAEAAAEEAARALEADPLRAEALLVRARSLLARGLKAPAATDLRRAIELRPDLRPVAGPLLEQAERP